MIPLPYKLLGMLVLLAGVFMSGWTAKGWQRDSQEKENDRAQYETNIESERFARRSETAKAEAVILAQNASRAREAGLRAAARNASSERERLRGELADAQARLPSQSHQACIDRAAALSEVFDSCTGRYTDVAEKADRHADDAQTITDAWPENPP